MTPKQALARKRRRRNQNQKTPTRNKVSSTAHLVCKRFTERDRFKHELAAYKRFSGSPYIPRLFSVNHTELILDLEHRGTPIEALDPKHRPAAVDVMWALGAVHAEGFAHCDLHAGNVLVDDKGRIAFVDLEWSSFSEENPLRYCYDLRGSSKSVGTTLPILSRIHWDGSHTREGDFRVHRRSLQSYLNTKADEAYGQYVERLKNEVKRVSGFKIKETFTRDNLVYQTFTHPLFSITNAQRDTDQRMVVMGLQSVKGSVLDLGSNTGSMAIACAQRGASFVTGVEADQGRVDVARRVAGVCGLQQSTKFVHARIEDYLANTPQHDVVLALAVDVWVQDAYRFYNALDRTARRMLVVESNRRESEQLKLTEFFKRKGWIVHALGDTSAEDAFKNRRFVYRMERK